MIIYNENPDPWFFPPLVGGDFLTRGRKNLGISIDPPLHPDLSHVTGGTPHSPPHDGGSQQPARLVVGTDIAIGGIPERNIF